MLNSGGDENTGDRTLGQSPATREIRRGWGVGEAVADKTVESVADRVKADFPTRPEAVGHWGRCCTHIRCRGG